MATKFFLKLWKSCKGPNFGTDYTAFWFRWNQLAFTTIAGVLSWEVGVGRLDIEAMVFLNLRSTTTGRNDIVYNDLQKKNNSIYQFIPLSNIKQKELKKENHLKKVLSYCPERFFSLKPASIRVVSPWRLNFSPFSWISNFFFWLRLSL